MYCICICIQLYVYYMCMCIKLCSSSSSCCSCIQSVVVYLLYQYFMGAGVAQATPCCYGRVVRPRIFESKFKNHCANKLVGALRKPTSFMLEFV